MIRGVVKSAQIIYTWQIRSLLRSCFTDSSRAMPYALHCAPEIWNLFQTRIWDMEAEWRLEVIKFIYSEKATKFCEIFPLLLTTVHTVKSKGKIFQNFVAFSEYMNFTGFCYQSHNGRNHNKNFVAFWRIKRPKFLSEITWPLEIQILNWLYSRNLWKRHGGFEEGKM